MYNNRRRNLGIALTILGFGLIIFTIIMEKRAAYQYERDIQSYWNLADKSSTLDKKTEQIDNFVNALAEQKFERKHDAIIFKTMDNSFDENFIALLTLQQRLHEIQEINITSFEYQKAIEQITAQEQGGACQMLGVFHGIWYKEHHILLWDWICFLQVCICLAIGIIGLFKWGQGAQWDI